MDNINFNQNKNSGFKLSEVIIIVLITCSVCLFAGISYGKTKYSDTVNINNIEASDKDDEALNNFIKQYKYIISNYYDSDKVDENELLKIALKSILEELGLDDVYSTYMDDNDYSQLKISLKGNYTGIGIAAYKEEDVVVVSSIIDDSPASKSDIKVGDRIISIDGKETKDMTIKEFCNYVLKSDDNSFVLKINRDGKDLTIKIEKENIELKSVSSEVMEKDGKKIGYIYMSVFAQNTYTQFKEHLNNLEKENIDSLVIDLRSNTGGYLTEVTKILNLFLEKKRVVYQLQKNDEKVKYYSKGKEDKTYPIIFIGNELTASASELFIISLKENLGAKLVGKKTYGKGTVQELVDLTNGDQYKITTKKWLSPNGNWINDTDGIEPDLDVQLSSKYIENPEDKNDNQLQEALKLAVKESKKK